MSKFHTQKLKPDIQNTKHLTFLAKVNITFKLLKTRLLHPNFTHKHHISRYFHLQLHTAALNLKHFEHFYFSNDMC